MINVLLLLPELDFREEWPDIRCNLILFLFVYLCVTNDPIFNFSLYGHNQTESVNYSWT